MAYQTDGANIVYGNDGSPFWTAGYAGYATGVSVLHSWSSRLFGCGFCLGSSSRNLCRHSCHDVYASYYEGGHHPCPHDSSVSCSPHGVRCKQQNGFFLLEDGCHQSRYGHCVCRFVQCALASDAREIYVSRCRHRW